ncbi:thiol-disulfide oxidoreductase ResA [bacterium BMS3Abin03]|nr:thiol-disulfide oxidoreductase ResA [bacterium BMS3Abin03]
MNRFYLLLSILFFFISSISFSQEIRIKIYNAPGKAVIFQLEGEKTSEIDSVIGVNNNFNFSLSNEHTGFYRLQFDNRHWIDFINDGKDIEIKTDYNNILDSLKVIKSGSNKIYYEFIKLNKDYKTKTELLQLILARYPKEDDYYQTTKEKLIRVREDYLYFINVTSQANPNSFIARYVRSAQLPVVGTDIPFDEQITYLKTHALDNVDFYDDELIYSDLFTNKTIEYISYYSNPQLPKELLEKEFMTAVDSILNKAKVNGIVYQHIVEYLIDGFKNYGFDEIIDHIVDNYVIKDDLCLDSKLESSIERRIDQARYFKIGNTVPDIIINDTTGKQIELNKIKADRILILFYASWCPHCQEIVPKISELYNKQKENKTEVFAVSVDTNKTDWINFIKTNKLDWINVSDLQGWYGKAAKEYYLYATPTMFLIDNNMKIIGIPKTIEELKKIIL